MLRYGILGFGLHAEKRLMPGFRYAEHSTAVAFWRNSPIKAAATARRYGIKSCATAEELCRASDVEAIFVTSPDALHLAHVELALRWGKPVLCEKPLGMNAGECEQMMRTAQQAGVPVGVAQVFRFEESVNCVRKLIASGDLGEIKGARAEFVYSGLQSARTWITDPKLACGGPTADVGVHCFDALRYVLRDEAVEVKALMQYDSRSGSVEASAEIILAFARGALANVFVSTRGSYRTGLELVGSELTLDARNCFSVEGALHIELLHEGSLVKRIHCDNHRVYGKQFDAFAESIAGGAEFPATVLDGLRNQQIIDAAYASARHGNAVALGK